MTTNFRNSSYESPRNNSIKLISVLFTCAKSTSNFFLLAWLGNRKKENVITATSRQQEIEMVCLNIKYYHDILSD